MGALDNVIFGNKKFSDILSEIYDNQTEKKKQITGLISELKPLISDIGDATLIVPLIKEYLDVAVKNDDHLVKLTAITQRYISTTQTISGESSLLSDDEKQQLLDMASKDFEEELSNEIDEIDQEAKEIKEKISNVKSTLENNNVIK